MFKKSFSLLNFSSKRLLSLNKTNVIDWGKQEKLIMEPFDYIHELPCKHYYMTVPAFNHWLQIPEDKLNIIDEVTRAWCTWNILLDDIQDNSPYRYGMRSAYQVFGVALTINAAHTALLRIQKLLKELGNPLALEIFMKRLNEYVRSHGIDTYWREKYELPTEEEHIEVAKNKSGAHFAFPVEAMQLFSNNKTDYVDLALDYGIYYELVDDYYSLFEPKSLQKLASNKQENYTTTSDITEGKLTLAIIHASQFPDVSSELADILKQRTSNPELKNRAIELMKKHGSDEYVKDVMKKLEADMRKQIDLLGGNPMLTQMIDELSVQKL